MPRKMGMNNSRELDVIAGESVKNPISNTLKEYKINYGVDI